MDNLLGRVDALEHQLHTLQQQTRAVERRLRWWRGLVGLGLLTWALPSVTAQDSEKGLAHRVAALETLLKPFSRKGNEVVITGANLRIVNGLGATDTTNGLGNLIVGYNEPRQDPSIPPDVRTGSHNVVVGIGNNFSRFGGLVVGGSNEISGEFAAVLAGIFNTASGVGSSVSGGNTNTASAFSASVSGGGQNVASGQLSSVSGGSANTASEFFASVSGGEQNLASGNSSSVSGGRRNIASSRDASVSGGLDRRAEGEFDWVAGSLFEDE
jgi:trimeric autotransporter adhesin